MFAMIFVNDIAGVSPQIVPAWMRHYHGPNGMTFVDVVFPAFLFIAGMSIPFALGSRLSKQEPLWKIMLHILTRTVALLFLGVMMVNGSPDSAKMGWSAALWVTLMYLSAILAFCSLRPSDKSAVPHRVVRVLPILPAVLRCLGLAVLVFLAFTFVGNNNQAHHHPLAFRHQHPLVGHSRVDCLGLSGFLSGVPDLSSQAVAQGEQGG